MNHEQQAIQDQIKDNHCYGCGADNPKGLQIKSYWQADGSTVCYYSPQPHQCAGPLRYLNGGVIATLIDCHSIGTALANAYRSEGRDIGTGATIWYVTGQMNISYKRPTEIKREVKLVATVREAAAKKTIVDCQLFSDDNLAAEAEVIAIRVPDDWA